MTVLLAGAIATRAYAVDADNVYVRWDMGNVTQTNFNVKSNGFAIIDADEDEKTWSETTTSGTFRNKDGQSITAVTQYYLKSSTGSSPYADDDWLLTPSITFEAGKTYKVAFTLAKFMFAALPYEIKMGASKTVDGMTVALTESDAKLPEYGGNSLWTVEASVSVQATGEYYMGFHQVSSSQAYGIVDITIEKGVAMVTPVAIADLTVTPGADGAKSAKIEFTAPSKAKDGTALASLGKIEVRRDGALVETFNNPTPGQKYDCTDVVAVSGLYTYTAVAYTEAGGGDIAETKMFVGVNTPADVTDVKAVNVSNTGAKVTWVAPAVDKDGYAISPSVISYDVQRKLRYSGSYETVKSDVKELSYVDYLPAPTPAEGEEEAEATQDFYQYRVIARTSTGEAAGVESNPVAMGAPYALPFFDSFKNGRSKQLFTSEAIGEGPSYWQMMTDGEDMVSSDGDNGMYAHNGKINSVSALSTGLIDLSGSESPVLSFYTLNLEGCSPADHTLQVSVAAVDGSVSKAFDEFVPSNGWHKTLYELSDFIGKTVVITFTGSRNNGVTYLCIDAVSVSNVYPNDLKAEAISVPEKVKTDNEFDVSVTVLNFGYEDAGAYTVDLFRDGEKVQTEECGALAVGDRNIVAFKEEFGILAAEKAEYYAVVNFAGDDDTENNTTEAKEVIVRKPNFPTVDDLHGSLGSGSLAMTWSEPDTSKGQPYDVTETFDEYESWATSNVGDWVFVDKDKALIAGLQGVEMPGVPSFSQQSWWIFDNSMDGVNNGSFATLSGNKFLASMVCGHNSSSTQEAGFDQNDDWAISPELFGGEQTITVNARSYDAIDLESFEVLYSEGSVDPADFKSLAKFEEIPFGWDSYTVDLPDGARRFAIRNISLGKLVLMVDDVNYTPVGEAGAFTINGYNIYRDGVKLNTEPLEDCAYTDNDCGDGDYDYNVTVLYSVGESLFGNTYNPITGGAVASAAVKSVDIRAGHGNIVVTGAEGLGVSVFTVDGRVVYSGTASVVPVPDGIYVVKAGTTVRKVVVM